MKKLTITLPRLLPTPGAFAHKPVRAFRTRRNDPARKRKHKGKDFES